MGFGNFGLSEFILVLLVWAAIFLALRAVFLWYWKVSKIVTLLESIDRRLSTLEGSSSSMAATEPR